MNALINTLIQFIIVMAAGYIACRIGILNENATDKISALIVKITMPAMILASACNFSGEVGLMYISILAGLCIYIALPLLAKLISVIFRIPLNERGIYEFMMIFGNVGFMGMPLANAVFGSDAVLYVSVLQNLPFNLLIYTYGVYLFKKGGDGDKKISPKLLLQPGVLVIPLALLILILDITLPSAIVDAVEMIGSTTTPLSMMIIGTSFVGVSIKQIFGKKYVYVMSAFRLLLVPILGYLALSVCGVPQVLCNIFVATSGLPVAATTVIYSHTYKGSAETAAAGVFVTTVLCILTVPLVMYILGINI